MDPWRDSLKNAAYINLTIRALIALTFILLPFRSALGAAPGEVRISAQQLTYSKTKEEVSLRGTVRFYYKEAILAGDEAVFNTRTKIGKVKGNVRIYQPGTTLAGDEMTVYYDRQKALLKGNAKLVIVKDTSSPQGGKGGLLQSGVTTLTCNSIEYEWIRMEGRAQGDVTVTQKDRRAFADKAHFSGGSEIITLEGNVRFEEGANNWVTCNSAVIDLRLETFMATGAVTGNFLVNELKDDGKKTGMPGKTPDKIVVPSPRLQEKTAPE
jgi:lipopolysaccharide assembly outer membrane protein LptD (OstA)